MSDHPWGLTRPLSRPSLSVQILGPLPYLPHFSQGPAGVFPEDRLLQHPHPIHQTLQATSLTLPPNPTISPTSTTSLRETLKHKLSYRERERRGGGGDKERGAREEL